MPPFQSSLATSRGWVDPLALPKYGDAAEVSGNAPADAKQLTLNTLGAYGVGDTDCFAYAVGRQIRIAEMNVERKGDKAEVVVVSGVQVTKGTCVSLARATVRVGAELMLGDKRC